jgi:nitrite reductase (NO-forming)
MKPFPLLPALIATLALACSARAALPHVRADLAYAPKVPPPITRHQPAIVEVDLSAGHKVMPINSLQDYPFWTFNDHVPGPFIRARQGDWLEVHMTNTDTSGMPHNVDFHAATGPGGGANILTVAPGQQHTAWLRLLHPGLFMYHCSVPPMMDHIANGMYGLILVEPTNGLPRADREFYVMQGEFYTKPAAPEAKLLQYSHEKALAEDPKFVLFNGQAGALMFQNTLRAETGQRVRFYFGNAGPNLISSFHIIGTVMDKVYREGSLSDAPARDLQTALVTPGSAAIVEAIPVVPGMYAFLDHSAAHSEKGAMGDLTVSGPAKADVYRSDQDGPPPSGPVASRVNSLAGAQFAGSHPLSHR